jgi:hypothetical protein
MHYQNLSELQLQSVNSELVLSISFRILSIGSFITNTLDEAGHKMEPLVMTLLVRAMSSTNSTSYVQVLYCAKMAHATAPRTSCLTLSMENCAAVISCMAGKAMQPIKAQCPRYDPLVDSNSA